MGGHFVDHDDQYGSTHPLDNRVGALLDEIAFDTRPNGQSPDSLKSGQFSFDMRPNGLSLPPTAESEIGKCGDFDRTGIGVQVGGKDPSAVTQKTMVFKSIGKEYFNLYSDSDNNIGMYSLVWEQLCPYILIEFQPGCSCGLGIYLTTTSDVPSIPGIVVKSDRAMWGLIIDCVLLYIYFHVLASNVACCHVLSRSLYPHLSWKGIGLKACADVATKCGEKQHWRLQPLMLIMPDDGHVLL